MADASTITLAAIQAAPAYFDKQASVLSDLRAAGQTKSGGPARADGVLYGLHLHDQGPVAAPNSIPIWWRRTQPGADTIVVPDRREGIAAGARAPSCDRSEPGRSRGERL